MNESKQSGLRDSNLDFDLYKVLIDQVQRDHTRWVDNFRVLYTWNTIFLAVTVASTLKISECSGADPGSQPCSFAASVPVSLIPLVLSCSGAAIAIITPFVVCRIDRSAQDWYKRIRDLEAKMENACLFSKNELPFKLRYPEFRRGVKGRYLYHGVSISFIGIYFTIASVVLSRFILPFFAISFIGIYGLVVYGWLNRVEQA